MIERSGYQERIRFSAEFPESPRAQFTRLFSALGNSASKCVTLRCIPQLHAISELSLHHAYRDATQDAWVTSHKLQKAYCVQTLVPIGAVAEVDFIELHMRDFVLGFRKTQAGIQYGDPIANFLIQKATQLPQGKSLYEVFGETASAGSSRGIINRADILDFLAKQNGPTTRQEVFEALGIHQANTITKHLTTLHDLEFIHYDSIDTKKDGHFYWYSVIENREFHPKRYPGKMELKYAVQHAMDELKEADAQMITDKLFDDYHGLQDRNAFRLKIARVLNEMAETGYCTRESHPKFNPHYAHSEVWILDAGREVATQVVQPIKAALEGNNSLLEEWRHIDWLHYAPDAVALDKQTTKRRQKRWF